MRIGYYGHIGDGCTIRQSHIASHHARRLAPTLNSDAVCMQTLAVVHAYYLIDINMLRFGCLVDIGVHVVCTLQFHPIVFNLVTAQDAVEVAQAGCLPLQ